MTARRIHGIGLARPGSAILALSALVLLRTPALAAQDALPDAAWRGAFEAAFDRAAAAGGLLPSALARKIALAECLASSTGLAPEAAAARALDMALKAERALRFGASAQEARSGMRQAPRLAAKGEKNKAFMKEREKRQKPLALDKLKKAKKLKQKTASMHLKSGGGQGKP